MSKPANENAIDWVWNNHDHPAQVKCYAYPIHIDLDSIINAKDLILRGNKTGNECVVEAIRAARAGNQDTALRWLMSGQCHNDDAQRDIHDAGHASVDYALKTYGSQVP